MAISDDLFLAILSMDAYNRGYAAGLGSGPLGLGDVGSSIGNATVITQSPSNPNSLEVQKPFFAQAYTWNGQTVISYRGTDTPSPFSSGNDFWTGWTLGAGFPSASQGTMARQFYETVTGQSVFAAAPSDVILTGHSLGGGLAGFIGALSGAETVGFDHMPFGQAAIAALLVRGEPACPRADRDAGAHRLARSSDTDRVDVRRLLLGRRVSATAISGTGQSPSRSARC